MVNEKHSASGLLHSDVDTCVVLTVSSTVVAELVLSGGWTVWDWLVVTIYGNSVLGKIVVLQV